MPLHDANELVWTTGRVVTYCGPETDWDKSRPLPRQLGVVK